MRLSRGAQKKHQLHIGGVTLPFSRIIYGLGFGSNLEKKKARVESKLNCYVTVLREKRFLLVYRQGPTKTMSKTLSCTSRASPKVQALITKTTRSQRWSGSNCKNSTRVSLQCTKESLVKTP